MAVDRPETRYARSGEVSIAYQVFLDGKVQGGARRSDLRGDRPARNGLRGRAGRRRRGAYGVAADRRRDVRAGCGREAVAETILTVSLTIRPRPGRQSGDERRG
jgi:hypothetical protein